MRVFYFSGGFLFTLPAGFSDDGSCEYDGVDENNDGIPDNSLQGCESPGYFNYNPNFAVWDPSSYVNTYSDQITTCIPFTYGCVEENACNYNSSANTNDVSNPCTFPFGCDTCSGEDDGTGTVVNNDADGDGVCDNDEIAGCQSNQACNYNSSATDSDGSCIFPIEKLSSLLWRD